MKFTVSGRVQGVFFRASAAKFATQIGLHGWVRNLGNGNVESFACATPALLSDYQRWLQKGPPLARVEEVVSEEAACEGGSGFAIR